MEEDNRIEMEMIWSENEGWQRLIPFLDLEAMCRLTDEELDREEKEKKTEKNSN